MLMHSPIYIYRDIGIIALHDYAAYACICMCVYLKEARRNGADWHTLSWGHVSKDRTRSCRCTLQSQIHTQFQLNRTSNTHTHTHS